MLFLIEIDCQVTAQEGGGGRGAESESGTSGGCSSNPSALGALLISIARTPRKLHLIRRTPKYCQTQTHTLKYTHTQTDTLRARQVAGKSARICEIHKILQGGTLILFACFLKWQPRCHLRRGNRINTNNLHTNGQRDRHTYRRANKPRPRWQLLQFPAALCLLIGRIRCAGRTRPGPVSARLCSSLGLRLSVLIVVSIVVAVAAVICHLPFAVRRLPCKSANLRHSALYQVIGNKIGAPARGKRWLLRTGSGST